MTNSNTPLVSILTPSFNQGQWLEDNLRSIQAQTYPNIEQIVMDGGSTDTTVDILKNAAPNVSWTSEPDRGQSHALNKAFAASKGEIIGWINSDDAYIDRRSVETVVRVFEENPDVDVVFGHGLALDQTNEFIFVIWSPPYIERFLELSTQFVQPSTFFRRSVLTEPLVQEELHYVMDWDLFLRLQDKGATFRRIPLVVGLDRRQADRKTLNSMHIDEQAQLLASRGTSFGRRIYYERWAMWILKRFAGLNLAVRFEREVQSAIDVHFPAMRMRIYKQLLLRTSRNATEQQS